ncbi:MAG: hypothetical protein ACI4Q4_06140 [Oscillospiraceae bacterium]
MYENIIALGHYRSEKHTPMPRENRAAQFAPFAALTGYDELVTESARLTDSLAELDDTAAELLDRKLAVIFDRLDERPAVTVTYFVNDSRKSGGAYITESGNIRHIDMEERMFVFTDGRRIPLDRVTDMSAEIFTEYGIE